MTSFSTITSLSLALILCLLSTACVSNDRASDIAALEGDAATGQMLYDVACSGCHGSDGKGGDFDVSLVFARRVHRDAALAQTLIEGEGTMPSYDQWNDQQIADVIAYINDL
jgi:mono/diheme cytochrome c family protein